MNKLWTRLAVVLLLAVASGLLLLPDERKTEQRASNEKEDGEASPEGRFEYMLKRLADPNTGEMPEGIRMRELSFASTLPKAHGQRDELSLSFDHLGPYNVGGRTRAFAIDQTNVATYFAGGVSGGMWRSTDAGETWHRVTAPEDHSAVSCIAQDPRFGKTSTWYYGSGETVGNSASKSYSAFFRGNGIYKSTDGGQSWTSLSSTVAEPQKASDWDAVFRIVVDPVRNDSDIVYAALQRGIMRSTDGGTSWTQVLGGNGGGNAAFSDIAVTSTGIYYAAISTDANGQAGLWRSEDGINWAMITPGGFPASHERTLISIYGGDENVVYFFSATPGFGTIGNSLWKYRYVSGDGSGTGGQWINRSSGLPNHDLNLYSGYCQVLGVKPDNEDIVFVGGTNLYRSDNGFLDTFNTVHCGGYAIDWDTNYSYRQGTHYPDQQFIAFDPTNPDRMISTADGGIFRSDSCGAPTWVWQPLNNGYVTSQFYGIAIDHGTIGSEEVMGGLQDRGTFWTDTKDFETPWVSIRGADGAYVAIEDGGEHYYTSTQYANIRRMSLDDSGNVVDNFKVMPPDMPKGSGSGLLFVHPFTLDPVQNNIMYLPYENEVWRNDNLALSEDEDLSPWLKTHAVTGTITAIAASENPQGVLYVGTNSQRIYRMEDVHTNSFSAVELVSTGITGGGWTSCIAIDPQDADKVIVVYSNYNAISLWYTEDGGENWEAIEGNLKGNSDPNVPPSLYYIGDGPSMRWAEIVHTSSGPVYFLGTSVGLFSTRALNGDSTVWTQQGSETIGNVVVDMLDYRASDQWLVVGTHGNGIYASNIEFITPEGVGEQSADDLQVKAYPNPVVDHINISYTLPGDMDMRLSLFDSYGRMIRTQQLSQHKGKNTVTMSLAALPAGTYYYSLNGDGLHVTRALVKQ